MGGFLFDLLKPLKAPCLLLSGPPFTHQQTPHKMVYYGQTSCEQDTERYLDVVKYVFSSYKKEVPLIINTMGWVKGKQDKSVVRVVWREGNNRSGTRPRFLESPEPGDAASPPSAGGVFVTVSRPEHVTAAVVFSLLPKGEGLLLLIDTIRLLSPSHVVQMDVYDWKAMAPLTPEYVHLAPGLYTKGKQQARCKQMDTSEAEGWRLSEEEGDASAPEYKLLYVHPEFPRAGVAGEA